MNAICCFCFTFDNSIYGKMIWTKNLQNNSDLFSQKCHLCDAPNPEHGSFPIYLNGEIWFTQPWCTNIWDIQYWYFIGALTWSIWQWDRSNANRKSNHIVIVLLSIIWLASIKCTPEPLAYFSECTKRNEVAILTGNNKKKTDRRTRGWAPLKLLIFH